MLSERDRAYRRKYNHSLKGKETMRRWKEKHSKIMKQHRRKWRTSKKGKEWEAAYTKKTESKIKTHLKKWRASPHGKELQRIHRANRRASLKRVKKNLTTEEWLAIRNRSPICPMCGRFVEVESLTMDHIMPISRGGAHSKENIQALCLPCNKSKNDKLPLGFKYNF